MHIDKKVDALKVYVNYDKDTFVQDTLEFPYDFYRAVEYALQVIGNNATVFKKTIWIPFVNEIRYYPLDLTKYTEDNFSIAKITQIGFIDTNGERIGKLDQKHLESIESNEFVDWFYVAKRMFGSETGIKTSQRLQTVPAGKFVTIVSLPANNQIELSSTIGNNTVITNLSFSDKGDNYQCTYVSGTTTITVDKDVKISPYEWAVGNRLYLSEGQPSLLTVTFRAIPNTDYFPTKTEIPIQQKDLQGIDDFAVSYLFNILIARKPVMAQYLQALYSTGVIKPYHQAILELRRRNQHSPIVLKAYDPY